MTIEHHEHYDRIEILKLVESEKDTTAHPTIWFSYLVKNSTIPLRVGYPGHGTVVLEYPRYNAIWIKRLFAQLQNVKEGDILNAHFREEWVDTRPPGTGGSLASRKRCYHMILVAIWEPT